MIRDSFAAMGEVNIPKQNDKRRLTEFMRALLADMRALEFMLEHDRFEAGIRRIGAEQEMFLVDSGMGPAPLATEILETLNEPFLTTELARFNLEANLEPRVFGEHCLREMEEELSYCVERTREGARKFGANVLLCGTLPTLSKEDLAISNMTPKPRYHELNRIMCNLRRGAFHVVIKGVDELEMEHDNVMLEACNTSFQIHFQVRPEEFAKLYNLAQAVTAPVLAAAVNSPVLLGQRLWQETRVALFQRSLDTRSFAEHVRGHRPRVHFGDRWVSESVLEIFREDIARFRLLIAGTRDEDPMSVLERGDVPKLSALRLHAGTIYRWNRACYGISDGKPHLRIENRVLPAGPSIRDEIANAAFFFGLMATYADEHPRIHEEMAFDDAKGNFFAAARHGLQAQFTWLGGKTWTAADLILNDLLPQAREGLKIAGINQKDSDTYLEVIESRVRAQRTGSRWVLSSLASLRETDTTRDLRCRAVASAMLQNQLTGAPVHEWDLASLPDEDSRDWRESFRTVRQFMTTDLLTVRPDDIVDLAVNLMTWEHIRHIPVEDKDGVFKGIISHRELLNVIAKGTRRENEDPLLVEDVMSDPPAVVQPSTPTLEAIALMRKHRTSSLPVLSEGKLVGLITGGDFMEVARRLLERHFGD